MDVGRSDPTAQSGRDCFLWAGRGKGKQERDAGRETEHMSERLVEAKGDDSAERFFMRGSL